MSTTHSSTGGVNARVLRLTESAVMLALATVLSLIKLIDLPYGGSVTPASAVPLLLVAWRYGCGWGCFAGLAHGLLQLVFSSSLSYVTGFWSVAAVVVLDFLVAFAAVGVAGVFRRMKNQSVGLLCGSILYAVLRYTLHVIAGATVWAGISVPTAAALLYSLGYNATYMLPETIITAAAAYFLGAVVDFRTPLPTRLVKTQRTTGGWLTALAAGVVMAAVVYDVLAIFPHTQNADTGAFDFSGLGDANWMWIAIVSGLAVLAAAVLALLARRRTSRV